MAKDSRSYEVNTVNKKPSRAETQHLIEKRISAGCERLRFSVLVGQFSKNHSPPPSSPSLGFMDREVSIMLHGSVVAGWKCVCLGLGGCMLRLFKADTNGPFLTEIGEQLSHATIQCL